MIYEPVQVYEGDGISVEEKEKEIRLAELREDHEVFRRIFSDLKVRKLKATWSIDAERDLQGMHGVDIQKVLTDAIRTDSGL
jgi:hypothetical protein